jgi:transcriptional regulator with XRE-family HTH domain
MTFAEKLKSIRKQAGMSQEQLAEKLGVSRQAVTKWETDAGIPDISFPFTLAFTLILFLVIPLLTLPGSTGLYSMTSIFQKPLFPIIQEMKAV